MSMVMDAHLMTERSMVLSQSREYPAYYEQACDDVNANHLLNESREPTYAPR